MHSASAQRCPWCGHPLALVWVHGHGQCARCGTNLEECCRGETAEACSSVRSFPRGQSGPVRTPERS